MDILSKELGLSIKNVSPTASPSLFTVIVHINWLKKLLKNHDNFENQDLSSVYLKPGASVSYPLKKVSIKVLNKNTSKALPLPRLKLHESKSRSILTYSQLLQYVSQNNTKSLWRDSQKRCHSPNSTRSTVRLNDYNQVLAETLFRLYGCNLIRISDGKCVYFKEKSHQSVYKYETHFNLLPAVAVVETDSNFYVIYNDYYENTLLDCLQFSPSLVDTNYTRGMFLLYQLLNVSKTVHDRGLSLGDPSLKDIYLTENLWLQILPTITNNIHCIDKPLLSESRKETDEHRSVGNLSGEVGLENLCALWVKGKISNLDYLLHLNILAGRSANDPQAHFIVPWVTDFTSRCGKNWRDLSKSKYRLNKGDCQLDKTYESGSEDHVPHHVTDPLSDITYYAYMARRIPKEVLCKHVRNIWVPAEYPGSIQRMQEWTPDECIPEFYTDPTIFKSIHEDLPDLTIPSWATCAEDFISKHREALESSYVSENLHHWIDITFGYKLSGNASIKAKNVCLSLVDGHTTFHRGSSVQLFIAPHPPRNPKSTFLTPPRMHWITKKLTKPAESSEDGSEEDSAAPPQHVSRMQSVPRQHVRSHQKSSSRARSLSKTQVPGEDTTALTSERASSHSRHYRVQLSEMGKGIIYLPKEFNPMASVQALETLEAFRTKCLFSDAKCLDRQYKNDFEVASKSISDVSDQILQPDKYAKHVDFAQKELRTKMSLRYVADVLVYKQFVSESKRKDMTILGCLIVEIFLHSQMRPLRLGCDDFERRYDVCRLVLTHCFWSLPKCVSYAACLLLNVSNPNLSINAGPVLLSKDEQLLRLITDKGLPPPSCSQFLQPLLTQHLIPFPHTFETLYGLLCALHEYENARHELDLLYTYECDGLQCESFRSVDEKKLYITQKIAEGKIRSCINCLDAILSNVAFNEQFDVMDIFLKFYSELLENKDTTVLAAWYLFDSVSKALGPAESKKKLLKDILKLYEDDLLFQKVGDKQKFVKLYHNIFLLQLMVRLDLQCFLDNFVQHLVEAVGGYRDIIDPCIPGHICTNKIVPDTRLRCSYSNLKVTLPTADIFSPDTSYGSDHMATPNVDKPKNIETLKDGDDKSDSDVFIFDNDREGSDDKPIEAKIAQKHSPSSYKVKDLLSPDLSKPSTSHNYPENMSGEKIYHDNTVTISQLDTTDEIYFTSDISHGDIKSQNDKSTDYSIRFSFDFGNTSRNTDVSISEISSESIVWLAHRLGPVLTCRYIGRNLLKMLTLCYMNKDVSFDAIEEFDEIDEIAIVNCSIVGDRTASKVINCLTAIVEIYGEQVIAFQYLPHASELIASCRRKPTAPLEAGLVACLHLVPRLLPYMTDACIMHHLQDTFIKSIVLPALRLAATLRWVAPGGVAARRALARKILHVLYCLAVRLGPDVTRQHICVPALQRFFLTFDKAKGKIDNWPKPEEINGDKEPEGSDSKTEGFIEICRDGSTAEWKIQDGRAVRADLSDAPCTPPATEPLFAEALTAQEELMIVFDDELAFKTYNKFANYLGTENLERCLKNADTIRYLCQSYRQSISSSPIQRHKDVSDSSNEEPKIAVDIPSPKTDVKFDQITTSNSFGSNVMLVGNRIDVACVVGEQDLFSHSHDFNTVAYSLDSGAQSSRHLRGDWLIYWEHEIGRSDKDAKFNLKQIKLQTFAGHAHSVKCLYSLDNENSFMSGSKDKTVKLWSLRNHGDGSTTSQCSWTYSGHKKGVLSLSFLESSRLAVSTDSVVHIWDPFTESVVSQLDHIKNAVSVVRALPGRGAALVAATTDACLKIIDARAPNRTYDLKVWSGSASAGGAVRCVAARGSWLACGLAGGHIAVLDARTGAGLALWRAHDTEVLRLEAVDDNRLLSSGLDQVTAVWRVHDGELIAHLKGPTEPVHCLSVYHNELISGTTNNRIGVHTSLDQEASFSSTKLRSDTFKGVLTCMSLLPLNRLLLLGSDNGTISLMC